MRISVALVSVTLVLYLKGAADPPMVVTVAKTEEPTSTDAKEESATAQVSHPSLEAPNSVALLPSWVSREEQRAVDAEAQRESLHWSKGALRPKAGEPPGGVWEVAEGGMLPDKGTCGDAALRALNLSFTLSGQPPQLESEVEGDSSGEATIWAGTIESNRPYPSDIQFSGRMLIRTPSLMPSVNGSSRLALLQATISRLTAGAWSVGFRVPTAIGASCTSQSERAFEVLEAEVLVTWVGTKYLGQKWALPPRNDNPPQAEMRRKCLDLTLRGNCARFGVRLAIWGTSASVEIAGHINPKKFPTNGVLPRCLSAVSSSRSPSSAVGYWRMQVEANTSQAGKKDKTSIVDDMVGLNRWRGAVWEWVGASGMTASNMTVGSDVAYHLVKGWYSRGRGADLSQSFSDYVSRSAATGGPLCRFSFRLHLVGDSMLVEQFYMWATLLGVPFDRIKNGKGGGGLRWMGFKSEAFWHPALRCQLQVEVRFVRGYTTSGGKSLIAPHTRLLNEIARYDANLVLTNLASLHWQQNMRPFSEWSRAVPEFVKAIRRQAASTRSNQLAVYWGSTQIQMGRTQGLNPSRTQAFNAVARASFNDAAALQSGEAAAVASTIFYDPLPVSQARWESSFDGQHWACYHRYGGVSISIALNFIAELLGRG